MSIDKKFALIGSVSLLALATTGAQAQNIDYGSLEDMFGQAVTTSATGKPQQVTDAPVTMDIITAEDIRRSGSNTIPGVLKRLSGLDYVNFAAPQEEVAVRGYNQGYSSRLLVLINGRQVYLNFFGMVVWDQLPVQLEEIRQIEVVKGPNTALFGFNATSGVINIVTYNPAYDSKGAVAVHAGNGGFMGGSKGKYGEARGFVSGKLSEQFGIRVSAGYKEIDPFKKGNTNQTVLHIFDKHKSTRGNMELVYMPSDGTKLALEFTGSDGPYDTVAAHWDYSPWNMDTKSGRFYGSHDTDFGLIKGQIYQNRVNYGGGNGLNINISEKLSVAQMEALINASAQHTFRVAGEYRKSTGNLSAIAVTPNEGATLDVNVLSISGLWDFAVNDKLSTAVSLRYDMQNVDRSGFIPDTLPMLTNEAFSDLSYKELTYNLGAVYKLDDTNTVRAMVSRGVQTPNSVDFGLFLQEPYMGNVALASVVDFKVSSVQNYEVGYDHIVESIDGMIRAAVYYQKSKNIKALWNSTFSMIPGATGPASLSGNIGDSEVYGFEAGIKGATNENLKWGMNYSYSKLNDDLNNRNEAGMLVNHAQYEEFNAPHHVNLFAGYTVDKWEIDVQLHYTSGRSAPDMLRLGMPYNEVEIPDNIFMDARIGYAFSENLEFEVKGTNMTKRLQRSSVQPIERRFIAGMRYTF